MNLSSEAEATNRLSGEMEMSLIPMVNSRSLGVLYLLYGL